MHWAGDHIGDNNGNARIKHILPSTCASRHSSRSTCAGLLLSNTWGHIAKPTLQPDCVALRMNDTLEELRPMNVLSNGITNEDAADSIPRPVKTADDTSPSGRTQPATATVPYYKLFRCAESRVPVTSGSVFRTDCADAATRTGWTSF